MSISYESLTYKNKFKRAVKIALIILTICIVVVAPAMWCWDQSIQKRIALREAKNVVLNMELLGLDSFEYENGLVDSGRASGLTKEAEADIRSYSGADGEIYLISWNTMKSCVTTMDYQKGRFLVQYRYNAKKDLKTWNIYWNIQQYDN